MTRGHFSNRLVSHGELRTNASHTLLAPIESCALASFPLPELDIDAAHVHQEHSGPKVSIEPILQRYQARQIMLRAMTSTCAMLSGLADYEQTRFLVLFNRRWITSMGEYHCYCDTITGAAPSQWPDTTNNH